MHGKIAKPRIGGGRGRDGERWCTQGGGRGEGGHNSCKDLITGGRVVTDQGVLPCRRRQACKQAYQITSIVLVRETASFVGHWIQCTAACRWPQV